MPRCVRSTSLLTVAAAFVVTLGLVSKNLPADEEHPSGAVDLFVAGAGDYHTYRIPALLATNQGTLLAFCEGRKSGRSDDGDIDLLLRRSLDGGRTWTPTELVHEEGGTRSVTIGNPCAVLDRSTRAVWLTFCRNNRDVLVTSSQDEGKSWSTPREITDTVKPAGWTWYATGPGVGIQLQAGSHKGRLVIPCDHREIFAGKPVYHSHVIYSDDSGSTWQCGGTVDLYTDECQVVEVANGELLINMRNYWGKEGARPERGGKRAVAHSRDGGKTWTPLDFDPALIEPVCQASLIAAQSADGQRVLLFSNPASTIARSTLTVRASLDDGKTWPVSRLVEGGSSAYSCLSQIDRDRIGLLYEREDYRRLTFITFSLAELLGKE